MDDLNTPLGQKEKPQAPKLLSARFAGQAAVALLLLALAGFVGWAAVMRDPLGGEPVASASVAVPAEASAKPDPKPEMAEQPIAPAIPPGSRTVTIIDGSSGKRQEVVIPPLK